MRTFVILILLLGSPVLASVTECPSAPTLSACLELAKKNYYERLDETDECEHSSNLIAAARDIHVFEKRACHSTCPA